MSKAAQAFHELRALALQLATGRPCPTLAAGCEATLRRWADYFIGGHSGTRE